MKVLHPSQGLIIRTGPSQDEEIRRLLEQDTLALLQKVEQAQKEGEALRKQIKLKYELLQYELLQLATSPEESSRLPSEEQGVIRMFQDYSINTTRRLKQLEKEMALVLSTPLTEEESESELESEYEFIFPESPTITRSISVPTVVTYMKTEKESTPFPTTVTPTTRSLDLTGIRFVDDYPTTTTPIILNTELTRTSSLLSLYEEPIGTEEIEIAGKARECCTLDDAFDCVIS